MVGVAVDALGGEMWAEAVGLLLRMAPVARASSGCVRWIAANAVRQHWGLTLRQQGGPNQADAVEECDRAPFLKRVGASVVGTYREGFWRPRARVSQVVCLCIHMPYVFLRIAQLTV